MSFIQPEFFLFFIVFFLPYLVLREKFKVAWLLGGSYFFYAVFSVPYCLLLIFSSLVDYFLALWLVRRPEKKKLWLLLSMTANLGLLCIFKYAYFFYNSLGIPLLSVWGIDLSPIKEGLPPMGISFFTFQTMSYTIDVYRGVLSPTRSIWRFGAYVSLFPQLVAGPIVRARDLLPQLMNLPQPTWMDFKQGSYRFIRGFVKKACIADSLAILLVDPVYAAPADATPLQVWIAVFAYGFQIYLDFSGYSDMAIGLGRMLGLHFPENFNYPYLARSFSDFWRRWHISLSSWLRDYLYIPLGGNRGSSFRTQINLMLTMVLGGLWHGADLMFVLWGVLHGLWLVLQRWTERWSPQAIIHYTPTFIKIGVVFMIVSLTWIPFRAGSLQGQESATLTAILSQLISLRPHHLLTMFSQVHWNQWLLLAIAFTSHMIWPWCRIKLAYASWPVELKVVLVSTTLFWCLAFFPEGSNIQPFIYFQF